MLHSPQHHRQVLHQLRRGSEAAARLMPQRVRLFVRGDVPAAEFLPSVRGADAGEGGIGPPQMADPNDAGGRSACYGRDEPVSRPASSGGGPLALRAGTNKTCGVGYAAAGGGRYRYRGASLICAAGISRLAPGQTSCPGHPDRVNQAASGCDGPVKRCAPTAARICDRSTWCVRASASNSPRRRIPRCSPSTEGIPACSARPQGPWRWPERCRSRRRGR